jgi:LacI family transcriptional regulator
MVQGEVDGVIGDFNEFIVENAISQIREEPGFGDRPAVSMIFDHPSLSCVTADDFDGGYQAMNHLLDLGHRHILSNERDYGFPHSTRVEGYRKALVDHGLDPCDESVLYMPWFQSPEKDTAEDIVAEIQSHPEMTGFLAYNDAAAVDLALALRARGVRIPEDISIVGYDDTHSVPDHLGANILTTVRLPLLEMGQTAAQVLIRRMNSPTSEDEHIILPVELVARGSTGPPRP